MDEIKEPIYVFLKVIWLSGKKEILQLPKDLQEAMQIYIEENPETWRNLFIGGLINIPAEPYKRNYEPRMTIAYIKWVFTSHNERKKRTRGQFLTKENWNQRGLRHFFQSLRFLQHDFKKTTQIKQFFDYIRWKIRLKNGKVK